MVVEEEEAEKKPCIILFYVAGFYPAQRPTVNFIPQPTPLKPMDAEVERQEKPGESPLGYVLAKEKNQKTSRYEEVVKRKSNI